MDVEGVFRLSGLDSSVQQLLYAMLDFSLDFKLPDSNSIEDVYVVTSTLKKYMQLTIPIIPKYLIDQVMNIYKSGDEVPLEELKNVMEKLKHENRNILIIFLNLMNKISDNYEKTKMDHKNLSIILTPAIFQPSDLDLVDVEKLLKLQNITQALLTHFKYIFGDDATDIAIEEGLKPKDTYYLSTSSNSIKKSKKYSINNSPSIKSLQSLTSGSSPSINYQKNNTSSQTITKIPSSSSAPSIPHIDEIDATNSNSNSIASSPNDPNDSNNVSNNKHKKFNQSNDKSRSRSYDFKSSSLKLNLSDLPGKIISNTAQNDEENVEERSSQISEGISGSASEASSISALPSEPVEKRQRSSKVKKNKSFSSKISSNDITHSKSSDSLNADHDNISEVNGGSFSNTSKYTFVAVPKAEWERLVKEVTTLKETVSSLTAQLDQVNQTVDELKLKIKVLEDE
eukprot:TRINITY_DN1449_c0_g1_i2.p1 TRINITY_DN1449_c0_g1~~TRINITY_DN1449_c0_g1_i2.p1  ORF type:complete len:455 (+),score=114.99 TRINITY_DN1449_c0_g1_i2:606-1970(+)